ncbi:uncharacterized protein LOC111034231 [Myzus persicae]|uniref:uncharacterized protein LOC111034231 n=1 Tax=Myzus persicae TaxID=13164 RepID=UPI000B937A26|nr:uncharacterized protein LOC111034231 [Myzus persicae]
MRRSIDYRIKEEAKITRTLFTAGSSYVDVEKILLEQKMTDLPKIDLSSFTHFDDALKNDIELFKKMKCFMVLNVKGSVKLSENLTTVIPKIISKAVQLQYSAFGRECNGVKKLNFSETETYKLLLEVLNTKFPDTNNKEISSVVSRWFSGAKDRDGGKKERSLKKMKFNKKDDVVHD